MLLKPFVLKPLGCSPFTGKKFWQLWLGWPAVPVLVSALTGTASSGTTARARTATAKKSFLLKFISLIASRLRKPAARSLKMLLSP